MWGKSKEYEETARKLKELKERWFGLVIRLRQRTPTSCLYRVDAHGGSLLIYVNGFLLFPETNYTCIRGDLILKDPLETDEITIVKLDTQETWRLTLNNSMYDKLVIQGNKKFLEI